MTDVETSRPTEDLTVDNDVKQESSEGSTEPARDDKVIAGFQKAIQEARERENATAEKVNEMQAKLKKYEAAEKERELSALSETDRVRMEAERMAKENAELKIKMLVNRLATGKDIPGPVLRALEVAPWEMVPEVKNEIGADPTYDDIVDALERHLPTYIDSLVVSTPESDNDTEDTPSVEPSAIKVDPERSGSGSTVVKTHTYTRAEIDRIKAMGDAEYEKHRDAILAQMKRDGGIIPQ
jgi:hypothetical protein